MFEQLENMLPNELMLEGEVKRRGEKHVGKVQNMVEHKMKFNRLVRTS